ncbi:ABC transporter permease [Chitinophaga barathri]|uniref:FtsX-like permease family protein n=1 Tax=Chitinophaga barathri TaxID=1647451 RepID=A0A3N4M953_9BACT|nr:ABC transporter permease [Chitinophaga barathri]RPD38116.1 FtsX-like permease family protein [Chitinophaga barathri]
MFSNYVKIAWRNFRKNRFYAVVNVLGLSAGIGFSLLVAAFAWKELNVNKQLKNADRQYIIQSRWKESSQGSEMITVGMLARAMKEEYPHLVSNFYRWDGVTTNVSKGDKAFREGLQLGDSTLLTMYGFELLQGDPKTAMEGPYSLVLTENKARKFFGKTDVLGQTLTIENFSGARQPFTITGVMKNPPDNSITRFDAKYPDEFYISAGNMSYFDRSLDDWSNKYIIANVELQPGVTPAMLAEPMKKLLQQNAPANISANLTPVLVPLNIYHLDANNGIVRKMLVALSAVAIFILFMAIINFVNLSISKSSSRMKEIGVRKVLGSLKKQLMLQFLTESTITVTVATIFAFLLYLAGRDYFSAVLGTSIPGLFDFPVHFIIYPILFILFTGLLAGIYPAFMLSSLQSVDSLKGKPGTVKENIWMRKALITFQFFTAAVVLIGAIIISQQIGFLFKKDLGYDREFVIAAQLPRNWTPEGLQKMYGNRDQFATLPDVQNASLSYEIPDANYSGTRPVFKTGADSASAISSMNIYTDIKYGSLYNLHVIAGDYFTKDTKLSDPFKVVINETFARSMGWTPQDALNQTFRGADGDQNVYRVAGVIKDFHFKTMREKIEPLMIHSTDRVNMYRYMSFKLKPGSPSARIEAVRAKWAQLMPGAPFEYTFIDDRLKTLYSVEMQLKNGTYLATGLSLVIVLLGILGLVSLSVHKRTKEIGIRKVLGASAGGIAALFVKDFLGMIIIGSVAAIPVAFLIMQKWLGNYNYRIDITAHPFVLTILILGIVSMLLIVLQTFRAAIADPVKSLKTE